MFVRTSLATALVAGLLSVAPAAHAALGPIPCTYDDVTGEMRVGVVDGSPSRINLRVDAIGAITLNGDPCSTDPMTGLLDHVTFYGGPHLRLTLDGRVGSFANGRGPDPGGAPEVKFRFEDPFPTFGLSVWGSGDADRIVAGANGVDLTGDGDVDVERAGIGALTLEGKSGEDLLSTMGGGSTGGPLMAATVLDGGPNDDTLRQADLGGTGYHALLVGGFGADRIEAAGDGATVDYSSSTQRVRVDLRAGSAIGQGSDVLQGVQSVVGSRFGDKLIAGGAPASFQGGAGNDLLVAGRHHGVLDGGSGRDTVSYGQATRGVRASLMSGTASWGPKHLVSIEAILGSRLHDVLVGDGSGNRLNGGGGDDVLMGAAGSDSLQGGTGSDLLLGGPGRDRCREGAGHGRQRACER